MIMYKFQTVNTFLIITIIFQTHYHGPVKIKSLKSYSLEFRFLYTIIFKKSDVNKSFRGRGEGKGNYYSTKEVGNI